MVQRLSDKMLSAGTSAVILNRCKKLLTRRAVYRYLSTSAAEDLSVYRLKSRGLVQVMGPDAMSFLQGLVTSDVTKLGLQTKAQYSMLLNVQGRVLYDLLLYRKPCEEPCILVECDRTVVDNFISDVKKYRIRKKVSLENVSNNLSVFAIFSKEGSMMPDNTQTGIIQVPDPRVPTFGMRAIANAETLDNIKIITDEAGYHKKRCQWGIPEGVQDLPSGNCFPLESNLLYMNGVSFAKGCYLGQELTARTHHTGVIRKHIMPLVFEKTPGPILSGQNILNESNKSVGKFCSSYEQFGIGVMRTADINGKLSVITENGKTVQLEAVRPKWWPSE